MKRNTTRPALAALAAATLLTACASTGQWAGSPDARANSVQVRVTNNNWMDMTVYALSGGVRMRLGTVSTGISKLFDLPRVVNVGAHDLRLVADPVGSEQEYTSHSIVVGPGVRVDWSIENHLPLSSYFVSSSRH